MDKIIAIEDCGPSEHDGGRLVALTDNGRLWCLEGPYANLGKVDWYEVTPPPGCEIAQADKEPSKETHQGYVTSTGSVTPRLG